MEIEKYYTENQNKPINSRKYMKVNPTTIEGKITNLGKVFIRCLAMKFKLKQSCIVPLSMRSSESQSEMGREEMVLWG